MRQVFHQARNIILSVILSTYKCKYQKYESDYVQPESDDWEEVPHEAVGEYLQHIIYCFFLRFELSFVRVFGTQERSRDEVISQLLHNVSQFLTIYCLVILLFPELPRSSQDHSTMVDMFYFLFLVSHPHIYERVLDIVVPYYLLLGGGVPRQLQLPHYLQIMLSDLTLPLASTLQAYYTPPSNNKLLIEFNSMKHFHFFSHIEFNSVSQIL